MLMGSQSLSAAGQVQPFSAYKPRRFEPEYFISAVCSAYLDYETQLLEPIDHTDITECS
jgi:hypothetical protein